MQRGLSVWPRAVHLEKRKRIRHTLGGDPFNNAVLVNEKSAIVIAEYSKGANSSGPEFAARGGVRCCQLRL